ncbi:hypothetical protein GCM10022384_12210 [Streptomyces marokkonensis]|uniref:Uncharacterized protein n=1 Tax=Streptomyces marokkonensis TaxID=324855 RepID=A0ABP7P8D3_9ACTN
MPVPVPVPAPVPAPASSASTRPPASSSRTPPPGQAGRAAGLATVALATTHRADELDADLVVTDLSALVTDAGVEISVRG